MPEDLRTVASPESLADRVYRPRLAEGHPQVGRASRLVSLPATLLGYLLLGLVGWLLVRHAQRPPTDAPRTVTVDLQDLPEGEGPRPAPAAPAPTPAGPPPGALVRPDAPPQPAAPDAPPDQPPAALPSQDLSNVAFPPAPAGGSVAGQGSGEPGAAGSGAGSGPGPRVVEYPFSQVEVLFQPRLEYPPLALSARVQGTVKVAITVGVDGTPLSAKAVEGPTLLRPFAEAYALKWRFKPSTENGVPVIASFALTVNYKLH